MPPVYNATFTSDPRSAMLAREAIGKFARLCGFSEEEVADIRSAVGEALVNAAHNGAPRHGGGFTVSCRFENSEIRVCVQNSGPAFDAGDASGTSFGTIIMRTLMSSVAYSRGGTRVQLTKRRPF